MEELRKRRGATTCIGSRELGRSIAVIAVVLGEDGWDITKDERREVRGEYTCFKSLDDHDEDAGDLWEKLFVIAGNFRPPRVHMGAEGERDEIV